MDLKIARTNRTLTTDVKRCAVCGKHILSCVCIPLPLKDKKVCSVECLRELRK